MTRGQGLSWRAADRTLVGHYGNVNPTNCIIDSIKKPSHECWEWLIRGYSQQAPGHHRCSSHLTHTHTQPCTWLLVHVPDGGKSEPLQTASEYTQILWAWEKLQTCTSSTTLGKAKGRLPVSSLAWQNQEKAYKLKNSATRGSKMCGVGMPIEKIYASEPPEGLTENTSLPKPVSKGWRRWLHFKIKDSSSRFQGI